MDKDQIFMFLNANPAFHLATLEEGAPRVRGMLLYRADNEGIVFHTGAMKDLHRQLLAEPRVELCFTDWQTYVQVRVRGEACLETDAALKREIVDSPGREFLRPWIEERGMEVLSVYRVVHAQSSVWTIAENFEPKRFIDLI